MTFTKDPADVLDYKVDWSAWLPEGDTITSSEFTVTDGLTISSGSNAPTHDDTTATVWLEGGTAGTTYLLTNTITTAAGRVDDRTIPVQVSA